MYQPWNEDVIIDYCYNFSTRTLSITREISMQPECPSHIDNLLYKIGSDLHTLEINGTWNQRGNIYILEEALNSINKYCRYGCLRHLKITNNFDEIYIMGTDNFNKLFNNQKLCMGLKSLVFEGISVINDIKNFGKFILACHNLNHLGLAGSKFIDLYNENEENLHGLFFPNKEISNIKSLDFSNTIFEVNWHLSDHMMQYQQYEDFLHYFPQLEHVKTSSFTFFISIINFFSRNKDKKRLKTLNIYGVYDIFLDINRDMNYFQDYIKKAKQIANIVCYESSIEDIYDRIRNHWIPNIHLSVKYKYYKNLIKNDFDKNLLLRAIHDNWKKFGFFPCIIDFWLEIFFITKDNIIQICQYINEILDGKFFIKNKAYLLYNTFKHILMIITLTMSDAIDCIPRDNELVKWTFEKLLAMIMQIGEKANIMNEVKYDLKKDYDLIKYYILQIFKLKLHFLGNNILFSDIDEKVKNKLFKESMDVLQYYYYF